MSEKSYVISMLRACACVCVFASVCVCVFSSVRACACRACAHACVHVRARGCVSVCEFPVISSTEVIDSFSETEE